MKNRVPRPDAHQKKIAALPAENARERNRRSGSIGAAARSSQATNASVSSVPSASADSTSTLPQPALFARTSPHTDPKAPAVTSASPGRSRLLSGPRLSSMRASAAGTRSSATGTLSQKIHGQETPSTTAPPTSGPHRAARPVTLLKTPIAQPRRAGGNAAPSSASASGITSAAPAPWTARPAISQSTSGASAHPAEAAANNPRPAANRLR